MTQFTAWCATAEHDRCTSGRADGYQCSCPCHMVTAGNPAGFQDWLRLFELRHNIFRLAVRPRMLTDLELNALRLAGPVEVHLLPGDELEYLERRDG